MFYLDIWVFLHNVSAVTHVGTKETFKVQKYEMQHLFNKIHEYIEVQCVALRDFGILDIKF